MRAPPYASQPDELFRRAAIEDPHVLYARLRDRHPISRVAETGVHLVATWELVEAALAREADFSANLTGVLVLDESDRPTIFELPPTAASRVIATADEPHHAVHRAIVQPGLTPARAARLEEPLRSWTRAALAPWLAAGGGDFVPIAELVPARAVARVLGLPDGDVSQHRLWAMMGGDILAGDVSLDRLMTLASETAKMAEYLRAHLERAGRNAQAGDEPLLGALARAVDRGELASDEAVGIATVMFGAGGESTAALIGSAVRYLAADPALADALREDSALVPRFVEEVARLEPPFKFHYRTVRRECELGGAELQPGDRLMLLWASANRDAGAVAEPDTLRLDRPHPKQHLSFGRGGHFCIGAPLARLEARVVCEELLAATTQLGLSAEDPPLHARSIFVRRLERLPVRVRTRASAN